MMLRCYDMSRLFNDCLILRINSAGASKGRWLRILQGGSTGELVRRLGAIVAWWGSETFLCTHECTTLLDHILWTVLPIVNFNVPG